MDPWLHQMIAQERRERWLRTAAAAREARLASHAGEAVEQPAGADRSLPSPLFESLIAPMPVPRFVWPRRGTGSPDEAPSRKAARR